MVRAVFLDLDGTVYRGSEACPDAAESVKRFLGAGLNVRYLTNNSAARPVEVCAKLRSMGVVCEPEWVLSSGMVTARMLVDRGLKRIGVVGNPGLIESLSEAGLEVVGFADAEAVAIGICHAFDYAMMRDSADAIRGGAAFYATNGDKTYPLEGGRLIPGAGSVVAAVAAASGVDPILIGKPERFMVDVACGELGIQPSDVVFVGDRVETDIDCARRAGCLPWLVLTGIQQEMIDGVLGSVTLKGLADYLVLNS